VTQHLIWNFFSENGTEMGFSGSGRMKSRFEAGFPTETQGVQDITPLSNHPTIPWIYNIKTKVADQIQVVSTYYPI
jgi:hypothetical protein